MVPIPKMMRILMAIVVGVSVPEGLSLLLGPEAWYTVIWGWSLTAMTAKFTAGVYLPVSIGFVLGWRETEWERLRIPLAMLWSFAPVALGGAAYLLAIGNKNASGQPIIVLDRAFTWIWFFLYIVSVIGGLYYHVVYPRAFGAKAF